MNKVDLLLAELKKHNEKIVEITSQLMEELKTPEQQAPEVKPITLEEVRSVLAEKSRAGHTSEVKALIGKYGATKLSEVRPEDYADLLKCAEEIQNA